MRVILTKEEFKTFIAEGKLTRIIPDQYEIRDVVTHGYPVDEFEIKLSKPDEAKEDDQE